MIIIIERKHIVYKGLCHCILIIMNILVDNKQFYIRVMLLIYYKNMANALENRQVETYIKYTYAKFKNSGVNKYALKLVSLCNV